MEYEKRIKLRFLETNLNYPVLLLIIIGLSDKEKFLSCSYGTVFSRTEGVIGSTARSDDVASGYQ